MTNHSQDINPVIPATDDALSCFGITMPRLSQPGVLVNQWSQEFHLLLNPICGLKIRDLHRQVDSVISIWRCNFPTLFLLLLQLLVFFGIRLRDRWHPLRPLFRVPQWRAFCTRGKTCFIASNIRQKTKRKGDMRRPYPLWLAVRGRILPQRPL